MDNKQQILEKALVKAIDGGWLPEVGEEGMRDLFDTSKLTQNQKNAVVTALRDTTYIKDIIFDQRFAKALWPGNHTCQRSTCGGAGCTSAYEWQYRLQQMVVASSPLKYLGDHI